MNGLKNLLIVLLAFFISITAAFSQNNTNNNGPIEGFNDAPKLVIGIVVDQMRADFISRFWNKFGDKGFKRLVNGGFLCENNYINYSSSETGPGHAAIYTGSTPSINGIIGNEWYSRDQKKMINCVDDNNVESVGTASDNGKRSPVNLLSNTITDQLHLATNFSSKVIAISLKARSSVLPGGFTSNGSYWFDVANGKFITSTYYMKELPAWLNAFNDKKLPASYITQKWNSSLPISQYSESVVSGVPYDDVPFNGESVSVFPHDLTKYSGNDFKVLQVTPFGNTLLKELAIDAIKAEQLGKGKMPDFLSVSFSSTDYIAHAFGINSIEVEDAYIKLDKDLGDLLDFLDTYIGKQNVLLFLSADHGGDNNVQFLLDHKIPAGLFEYKPVIDSLKNYLNNYFGKGDFITKYNNQSIYINRDEIINRKISLTDIENIAAAYLVHFKGIAFATTESILNSADINLPFHKQIINGYNAARSGDIFITLNEGWMESHSTGTSHSSPYKSDTHIPLIFYGWKVANGSYLPEVNITDIAPTLAHLLNIQPPNASTGKPIPVPLIR